MIKDWTDKNNFPATHEEFVEWLNWRKTAPKNAVRITQTFADGSSSGATVMLDRLPLGMYNQEMFDAGASLSFEPVVFP